MKTQQLSLAAVLALIPTIQLCAQEEMHTFTRVVIKNEIIINATAEQAMDLVESAKRDGKKLSQKYANAQGVVGVSTQAYDETIRRCPNCDGMEESDMNDMRCGCNKPRPKSPEMMTPGMMDTERCGCNKPKPRSTQETEERCNQCGDRPSKCGCSKPKPKSPEMMATGMNCNTMRCVSECDMSRCCCNKTAEETCTAEVERCGCSKPKPKSPEETDTTDTERCGCSKPKPKTN
jgi:hypothetical protein